MTVKELRDMLNTMVDMNEGDKEVTIEMYNAATNAFNKHALVTPIHDDKTNTIILLPSHKPLA